MRPSAATLRANRKEPPQALVARFFGPFSVSREDGTLVRFATAHESQLLACLLASNGWLRNREELAENIWPGRDESRQRSSLRNALSSLRRSLGSHAYFVADHRVVSLAPSLFSSDLQEAGVIVERLHLVREGELEEELLRAVLDVCAAPFLQGWNGAWIDDLRTLWEIRLSDFEGRLCYLLSASGRFDEALLVAEQAVRRSPLDEAAVARLMRSASQVNHRERALAAYEAFRLASAATLKARPSDNLRHLAAEIRQGRFRMHGQFMTKGEFAPKEAVYQAFASSLKNGDGAALRFVASDLGHWLRFPDSIAARDVLASCLRNSKETSKERCEVAMASATLSQLLSDYPSAEKFFRQAVRDADKLGCARLSSLANGRLGFLYLETRDYARSRISFSKALEHSRACTDPQALSVVQNNYGALVWHLGDLDVARSHFEAAMEYASSCGFMMGTCTISANLSLLAGERSDYSDAVRYGAEALRLAKLGDFRYLESGARTGLAVGLAGEGQGRACARQLVEALRNANRLEYYRFATVTLDKASRCMWMLSRPKLARWLANAGGNMRSRIGYDRSPAEERVVAPVLNQHSADDLGSQDASAKNLGFPELVLVACRRIERYDSEL